MRKLALVLFLALPLFGYEVRSEYHSFAVGVERIGDAVIYVIHVNDIKTGAVLVSDRFDRPGEGKFEAHERTLRVAVGERDGKLSVELDVEQNGEIIDMLRATWLAAAKPVERSGIGPFRVGGEVRAPVLVHRVAPIYTAEAREKRVAGVVIAEVLIDSQGNVVEAKVLKPLPFGLDEAAIVAVKQWKFKPGTINGEPVDVIFNLTVNFRVPEE